MPCHALAHIVEVGGAAAYHASEHDDRVIEAGLYQLGSGKCELDSAWHVEPVDVVGGHACVEQPFCGGVGEGTGYVGVPFGGRLWLCGAERYRCLELPATGRTGVLTW